MVRLKVLQKCTFLTAVNIDLLSLWSIDLLAKMINSHPLGMVNKHHARVFAICMTSRQNATADETTEVVILLRASDAVWNVSSLKCQFNNFCISW